MSTDFEKSHDALVIEFKDNTPIPSYIETPLACPITGQWVGIKKRVIWRVEKKIAAGLKVASYFGIHLGKLLTKSTVDDNFHI